MGSTRYAIRTHIRCEALPTHVPESNPNSQIDTRPPNDTHTHHIHIEQLLAGVKERRMLCQHAWTSSLLSF